MKLQINKVKGPCAKREVLCSVNTPDGRWLRASNACDNAQAVCPREPGEDYTKCKTICEQAGHAEQQLVALAEQEGFDLTNGTAYVHGHYWACEPCARALKDAGVTAIVITGITQSRGQ